MVDVQDKSRAELFAQEALKSTPEQIKAELVRTRVVIGIPKSLAQTRQGQIGIVTAVNIISRLGGLAPRLYLDIPGGATVHTGIPLLEPGQDLADSLLGLIHRLEEGQQGVLVRSLAERGLSYDYGLFIGNVTSKARCAITVGSDRWLAAMRVDGKPERVNCTDPNPLGIIFAAALGSTEVVKHMWLPIRSASVRIEPIEERVVVSTYDLSVDSKKRPTNPKMPDNCKLPHAVVCGLGAVGSACIYVLGCLPGLTMSLDLVDFDFLEPSNEERMFTSGEPNQDIGQLKVVQTQEFIQRIQNGVNTFIYPMRFQEFASGSRDRLGYVFCCLDTAEARRDLQSELPTVICNGGTDNSDWMFSVHELGNAESACLQDLYPRPAAKRFDPIEELAGYVGVSTDLVRRWAKDAKAPGQMFIDPNKVGDAKDPVRYRRRLSLLRRPYNQAVAQMCSTMKPNVAGVSGTISFLSILPGIAMVSDFLKRFLYGWRPEDGDPNFWLFDALSHPAKSKAIRMTAAPNCSCQKVEDHVASEIRAELRKPYVNRIFRSASLVSLPQRERQEVARRKLNYSRKSRQAKRQSACPAAVEQQNRLRAELERRLKEKRHAYFNRK